MNMRKIFFLVGLPRAGNTLLGSILNQNPDIAVTANSITPDILYALYRVKNLSSFSNFRDPQSFNNIAHHVFDLYYKDWNYKYIIDRGPWGVPSVLNILKETQEDIKIIVLVRDIIEVLASFIRWSHNRTDTFFNKHNVKTIEGKCDTLMQEDYLIEKNLQAVKHLLLPENKNLCHWVEYNNLVEHPKRTIEEIYDFLKISKFKHHYINLNQFEVNGMKYDDTIVGEGLHTIKSDKISKSNYNAYTLIPKSMIEKYKHFNIWKN
jgi:hypothetical protein